MAENHERARRFQVCIEQIEIVAQKLRKGEEPDIMGAMAKLRIELERATEIAAEVSRESLDKVTMSASGRATIRLKHPPSADSEIEDVLPDA